MERCSPEVVWRLCREQTGTHSPRWPPAWCKRSDLRKWRRHWAAPGRVCRLLSPHLAPFVIRPASVWRGSTSRERRMWSEDRASCRPRGRPGVVRTALGQSMFRTVRPRLWHAVTVAVSLVGNFNGSSPCFPTYGKLTLDPIWNSSCLLK